MRGIRIKLLEPSAVLNQELVLISKNGILRVCFTEINILANEVFLIYSEQQITATKYSDSKILATYFISLLRKYIGNIILECRLLNLIGAAFEQSLD